MSLHRLRLRQPTYPKRVSRAPVNARAVTLVEVVVAMVIFAVVATGTIAAFLLSDRLAKSNLAQGYAEMAAQCIIEQVMRESGNQLMNTATTGVEIKLPGLTSTNYTTMDAFSIPWSTDATTFTDIGTPSKGILVDAAYIANSNTIRPQKYMLMQVNLQRVISTSDNTVQINLKYKWEIPDRKNADGSPVYLIGELHSARSLVKTF